MAGREVRFPITADPTGFKRGVEDAGRSFSAFGAVLQGVGVGIGMQVFDTLASKAGDVARAFGDLIHRGTEIAGVSSSFRSIVDDYENVLQASRQATRGMVSDFELMQVANKGVLLGLPITASSMETLGRTAITLGKAMKVGPTQAMQDLITGLGRGSAAILDNLGITVRASEAYQNYANSLGKPVSELTDAEKKLAIYTSALAAASAQVDKMGDVQLTLGDRLEIAKTKLGNFYDKLAETVARSPALNAALQEIGKTFDTTFGTDIQQSVESIAGWIDQLAIGMVRFAGVAVQAGQRVVQTWQFMQAAFYSTLRALAQVVQRVLSLTSMAAAVPGHPLGLFRETLTRGAADAAQIVAGLDMDLAKLDQTIDESKGKFKEAELFLAALIREMENASRTGPQLANTLNQIGGAADTAAGSVDGLSASLNRSLASSHGPTPGLGPTLLTGAIPGLAMPGAGPEITHPGAWYVPPRAAAATEDNRRATEEWARALQNVTNMFQVLGITADTVLSRAFGGITAALAASQQWSEATTNLGRAMAVLQAGTAAFGSGSMLGGAVSGAAFGAQFGPLGAVIGGVGGGILGAIGGLFGRRRDEEAERQQLLDSIIPKLATLRSELEQIREAALQAGETGLAALFTNLASGADISTERLERLSRLGMAAFQALRDEGYSLVDAMEALGPALEAAIEAAREGGLELTGAFAELARFRELVVQNQEIVSAAEGLVGVFDMLQTSGGLTRETFTDLLGELHAVFADLIEGGFSSSQAIALLAPMLYRIREGAAALGIELDDLTQDWIDAAAAGGHFEGLESPMERMVELQGLMLQAVGALVTAFGHELPQAVQEYIDSLNRIPTELPPPPGGGGERPGSPRPSTVPFSGQAGSHGWLDFGAGTPAILHGIEAVVRPGDTAPPGLKGSGGVRIDVGGVHVSVEGGGDPIRIAQAIADALRDELVPSLKREIQKVQA